MCLTLEILGEGASSCRVSGWFPLSPPFWGASGCLGPVAEAGLWTWSRSIERVSCATFPVSRGLCFPKLELFCVQLGALEARRGPRAPSWVVREQRVRLGSGRLCERILVRGWPGHAGARCARQKAALVLWVPVWGLLV